MPAQPHSPASPSWEVFAEPWVGLQPIPGLECWAGLPGRRSGCTAGDPRISPRWVFAKRDLPLSLVHLLAVSCQAKCLCSKCQG